MFNDSNTMNDSVKTLHSTSTLIRCIMMVLMEHKTTCTL